VHRILTTTTYAGTHHFNRCQARTGAAKTPDQWISIPVPAIIPQAEFEQVQAQLSSP
jgi:hypothetical protein